MVKDDHTYSTVSHFHTKGSTQSTSSLWKLLHKGISVFLLTKVSESIVPRRIQTAIRIWRCTRHSSLGQVWTPSWSAWKVGWHGLPSFYEMSLYIVLQLLITKLSLCDISESGTKNWRRKPRIWLLHYSKCFAFNCLCSG